MLDQQESIWSYWNAVTDKVSLESSSTPLDYLLAKETGEELPTFLMSGECHQELAILGIESFALEHTGSFLELLTILDVEYQEMCIQYFLLNKKETDLATIHGRTQTVCSTEIRASVKNLASTAVLGMNPSKQLIKTILERAGLEQVELRVCPQGKLTRKSMRLSDLIHLFSNTRSFGDVANVFQVHRPIVRKALREVAAKLIESQDVQEAGLGWWIKKLYYRASPKEEGANARQLEKGKRLRHLLVRDSDLLGSFDIDVRHPHFKDMFSTENDPVS